MKSVVDWLKKQLEGTLARKNDKATDVDGPAQDVKAGNEAERFEGNKAGDDNGNPGRYMRLTLV